MRFSRFYTDSGGFFPSKHPIPWVQSNSNTLASYLLNSGGIFGLFTQPTNTPGWNGVFVPDWLVLGLYPTKGGN